ncbi:MAG: 50S ribosomal protein L18 [Alphaproteobacteria bacterium]|nr:50S ribosomal protein L18 [Alphaproteobacteria bacterium]MDD9919523.1 50S ribosomal protein L18 [Alphaproteobacteria bacterium]
MTNHNNRGLRASRTRHTLKTAARRNDRARLSVFRSNVHIYAQIISDAEGKTLVSASTVDKKLRKDIKNTMSAEAAVTVGKEIAKRATAAGIKDVYFDRGGRQYAGRIKALADAAREAGLNF